MSIKKMRYLILVSGRNSLLYCLSPVIRTTAQTIRYQLPAALGETIAFLCIAWSISQTSKDGPDRLESMKSSQFLRDLRRWEFVTPEDDRVAFRDAMHGICGCILEDETEKQLFECSEEVLRYFQGLACSLVSQASKLSGYSGCNRSVDDRLESSQQKWRLRRSEAENGGYHCVQNTISKTETRRLP